MKRRTPPSHGICPNFKVMQIVAGFDSVLTFLVLSQGGSFDPWGGPGYDACAVLTGPAFQDVFYKQNWASNAKLLSYYMLYGYDFCIPRIHLISIERLMIEARHGQGCPSRAYIPGAPI